NAGLSLRKGNPLTGQLGFIYENGDYDLWMRLCSFENPPPIRAVLAQKSSDGRITGLKMRRASDLYPADRYPSDAQVVDHLGHVAVGVSTENLAPWCIREPLTYRAELDAYLDANRLPDGSKAPYCPIKLVPKTDDAPVDQDHFVPGDDDFDTLW